MYYSNHIPFLGPTTAARPIFWRSSSLCGSREQTRLSTNGKKLQCLAQVKSRATSPTMNSRVITDDQPGTWGQSHRRFLLENFFINDWYLAVPDLWEKAEATVHNSFQQQFIHPAPARGPRRFCPTPQRAPAHIEAHIYPGFG